MISRDMRALAKDTCSKPIENSNLRSRYSAQIEYLFEEREFILVSSSASRYRNALKCEDKFVVVFSLHEFFAKDYKMKEGETKFIITTNKNTFRVLLSPPKKNHRCEYYCRKYALRTISRSHSAQTRDLAIRGTGQPAKGEQVFSGLTRDRG